MAKKPKKPSSMASGDVPAVPRMPKMPKTNGAPPKRKAPAPLAKAPPEPLMGDFEEEGGSMMPGMPGMMGPSVEEKLAEWLSMRVFPKNVPGLYFQLRQKSIDGEMVAHEWDATEVEGQDPDSLAAMIYTQAVEDSQGLNGVVSYAVHAMRPTTGHSESFSRCIFRLAQEDMTHGADSEPGHLPEGHMAQAHRHAEVYARMMVGQTDGILRHYREANRDLSQQASRAIQLQVQVAEMFQKIQDRGMMREIVLKRVARKEKMKEQLLGVVLSFVPDLAVRFGIVPGDLKAAISTAQGVEHILAELPEEKMQMLLMALEKQDQKEALMKAYIYAKQRAAAAAAKAAAEAASRAANGQGAKAGANGAANGHAHVQMGEAKALHGGQPTALDHRGVQSDVRMGSGDEGDAQSQNSQEPTTLTMTKAETQTLSHATRAFLGMMLDLPDEQFEAVASKLSADERAAVDRMRAKIRATVKP